MARELAVKGPRDALYHLWWSGRWELWHESWTWRFHHSVAHNWQTNWVPVSCAFAASFHQSDTKYSWMDFLIFHPPSLRDTGLMLPESLIAGSTSSSAGSEAKDSTRSRNIGILGSSSLIEERLKSYAQCSTNSSLRIFALARLLLLEKFRSPHRNFLAFLAIRENWL